MDIFETFENAKELELTDLLPKTEVSITNEKYICYYEEETTSTDRCFIYAKANEPADIELFQLTYPDKNNSVSALNSIDMNDENILFSLVQTGNNIIQKSSQEPTNMALLKSYVKLNNKDFILSYQSPNLLLLGKTMHDMYLERVNKRL